MGKKVRILIVGGSDADTRIVAGELRKERLNHALRRSRSKRDFLKAMADYMPDVILCECDMPAFSVPEMITAARAIAPETPLMTFSGPAGAVAAADAVRMGVTHSISKDAPGMIGSAILRALEGVDPGAKRGSSERAAEDMFRRIFDASVDGILLADMDGGRLYAANDAMCRLFGCGRGEIGSLEIGSVYSEKDILGINERIKGGAKGWIRLSGDFPVKRKDGGVSFADVNVIPFEISGRTYLMGFFHDITDQKMAEEVMILKKADKIRTELMSAISHELSTPLTAIQSFVSILLMEESLAADQKEYVNIIKGNVDRLARIVNDLLDVSKIEYGRSDMKKEVVDVAGLAKKAISGLQAKAEEKNIGIKTSFSDDMMTVYADADKVVRVFSNLIDNAIKFTGEAGQIAVEVKNAQKEAVCSVADTGVGIAPENLGKLFGEFQQFDREFGAGAKGIGLGLSIAKGLVEMHNGKIWAESKPGKGSKFIFTLPKYSVKALVNKGIEKASKDAVKMSVLVISLSGVETPGQELPVGEIQALLRDMEDLFAVYAQGPGDIVVRDTDRIVMILLNCNKQSVLLSETRLEQALGDYLVRGKLNKKVSFRIGYATYPDEASAADQLLERAAITKREIG